MVDWKYWPGLWLAQRQQLPLQSGIYVVVDVEGQVWYVGLSKNINSRWNGKGHHRYRQLNRSDHKRLYRIHWTLVPPEQLVAQEQYYIARFKPHLNYSRIKVYAKRARQPHQEISRLFKVLNQKTMLFPDLRSVVLGYYTEIDEDDITGELGEYANIVTVINFNDHDRTILNAYKKSYSKRAISLRACWGVHESNCGDEGPDAQLVAIPVFMSDDMGCEFVCDFKLIDRLAGQRDYLQSVTLAKQSVMVLRDPNCLSALLAADRPMTDHGTYLRYRATDLRPISELLERPNTD